MKVKLLLFAYLLSFLAFGQNAISQRTGITQHADKVMMHFGQSEFEEGFTELRKYYPVTELDFQNMKTKSIKNFQAASKGYDGILGEVFIKQETLKDLAVARHYVLKLGAILLRFRLVYYNGKNGWIVNSFHWDDDFEQFLD